MSTIKASRLQITHRLRRLRTSDTMRALVRETRLSPDMFVLPLFVCEGQGVRREVGSMPVSDYRQLRGAVHEKNIIVGVIAVPADSAQDVADELVASNVKIIFNYSEALLDVPHDVAVHASNPAVELLYALYFHLT